MVVNEDKFFLSHRKEIGSAALAAGWDVTIVAKDTGRRKEIEQLGLHFVNLPINPTGKNIFQELKVLRFLRRLYRQYPEALVHHVGLKLLLWGNMALRKSPIGATVNAISGLGTLFTDSKKSTIIRMMFKVLRYSQKDRKNIHYIFQNNEDLEIFRNQGLLDSTTHSLIKGAGVNLDYFSYSPIINEGNVKIVFTGRMIKEKGVIDLVNAAEILRPKYEGRVEFIFSGALSSNPSALTEREIGKMMDGKYIKWINFQEDIRTLLVESTIFCLPSHREGFPKSIIEASAIGRPIVTFDSVGCRDTVVEGVNGFKVPIGDYKMLADRLDFLISNPDVRDRMGKESRKIAEKSYDIRDVISKHLEIYNNKS